MMPLDSLRWLVEAAAQGVPILIDAAIKGAFILALAGALTIFMRRASAAMRHLIWAGAVAGALALPVLSALLPEWRVLPGWISGETAIAAPLMPETDAQPAPASAPLAIESAAPMILSQPIHSPSAPEPPRAFAATPVTKTPLMDWLAKLQWREWAIMIWLAGACVFLAPMIIGAISLRRIRRRARRIENGVWADLLRDLSSGLLLRRRVTLLQSADNMMPMTWGVLRTKILLPAEAAVWPLERKRAVLAHELAHVLRWDCLTQMLAQAARAIYWFNPLAWLAWRRLAAERERACDDLVLMCGAKASDYAEHLLTLATGLRSDMILSAAAIAMARPSRLEGRLLAILDKNRKRQALTRIAIILAFVIIAACVVPLSVLQAAKEAAPHPAITPAEWAKQRGWRARDIKKTTLESFWGGWRNLPFEISKEEQADALGCARLTLRMNTKVNEKIWFDDEETRQILEKILERRPRYFYAEFLLATWHRRHDHAKESSELFEEAYKHAPVVIAQRFEMPDGKPVVGVAIHSFGLECNRANKNSLDPTLELLYPDLITDSAGCIYLPVYETVYRTNNVSWPRGYDAKYPTLGWFESPAKVGLLPVCVVTPDTSSAASASATGRIAGRLLWGEKPGVNEQIQCISWESEKSYAIQVIHTDRDGRFVFDKVPAGTAQLSRIMKADKNSTSSNEYMHPSIHVDIKAGETTNVVLGGKGRPVKGRVMLAAGEKKSLAELEITASICLRSPSVSGPQEEVQRQWQAYHRFITSDIGLNYQCDPFVSQTDGSFRAERLPASPYVIQIRGTLKSDKRALGEKQFWCFVSKRFEVPPMPQGQSDEPLDLGALEIQALPGANDAITADERPTSSGEVMPPLSNPRRGLEFRIVPNGAGSSRTPLYPLFVGEGTDTATTESFSRKALHELADKGPLAAWTGGDDLIWFELAYKNKRPDALIGEYQGRKYILLCNRTSYGMIVGAGGEKNGYIQKVSAEKDGLYQSVSIEFDDVAGEAFAALTNRNLHNGMAIVVDGKAISAPEIVAKLGNKIKITGTFTQEEAEQLAAAIRVGMQSADAGTSSPK
ncbi:MAG: hypothetical protein NTX50_08600 [Candidatus Sumerlaeota bacterium]|nr:hypothetical protein [Candidatus Sumerlaeota bacterium]